MEKTKSSACLILIDTFLLCLITLTAALFLGAVYEITKKPIAAAGKKAENKALAAVLAGAHSFGENMLNSRYAPLIDEEEILAVNGFEKIKINEVKIAFDEKDEGIGYVMRITTSNGYSGDIVFLMGYRFDGTVTGIEFLEVSESPGLGLNIKENFFKDDFKNKKTDSFTFVKNREKNTPKPDGTVDALSGATISTRAVVNAVNAGICYAHDLVLKNIGIGELRKMSLEKAQ